MVLLAVLLGLLTLLSLGLLLWQWTVAARFPLHRRPDHPSGFAPPVTLLKPLKGADAETAACLRSWLTQDYPAPVQVLFGVASSDDPVCQVVRPLLAEHPHAELVVCPKNLGPNAKVSTLTQLEVLARHDVIVISDADVRVPADGLRAVTAPLENADVGLVNCFYAFANPASLAMRWEALAVNADFWSQVLQSRSLKPLDFALGAVMATRRSRLERLGGFSSLLEYLADDYQLGRGVAETGGRIELCPVVAECWNPPMRWRDVWAHQLRWSRTIRVCQPAPYFFSILSNATFWPVAWVLTSWAARVPAVDSAGAWLGRVLEVAGEPRVAAAALALSLLLRVGMALHLEARLTRSLGHLPFVWLAPVKDLLQVLIWALAFVGNTVHWRGETFRVQRGGKLSRVASR